jgi:hypothetical protein
MNSSRSSFGGFGSSTGIAGDDDMFSCLHTTLSNVLVMYENGRSVAVNKA